MMLVGISICWIKNVSRGQFFFTRPRQRVYLVWTLKGYHNKLLSFIIIQARQWPVEGVGNIYIMNNV